MHVRDYNFGDPALAQLEPGPTTAAVADGAPGFSIATYYKLAVAAGLTVWLVSKLLDGALFKRRKAHGA